MDLACAGLATIIAASVQTSPRSTPVAERCPPAIHTRNRHDAGKGKRVALYVRVSTDDQSTVAQKAELEAWAERAGHTVVKIFEDHGISGAKGRDKRPAFDALLKAAVRREVDMIAVWSC